MKVKRRVEGCSSIIDEGSDALLRDRRNEHVVHSEFKRMSDNISVADAVALLTR